MERRYARRPAVWGEAIEVPEMVLVAWSPPVQVDKMFKPKNQKISECSEVESEKYIPGAKTSVHLP